MRSMPSLSYMTIAAIVMMSLSGCQNKENASLIKESSAAKSTTSSKGETANSPVSSATPVSSTAITQAEQKTPVDWTQPSGGEYPILHKGEPVWIDVSIRNQRVYIKEGEATLYTMITSSGLDTNPDTSTPRGTFSVQRERGLWFYNNSEHEGAKYFVSWKNHGEFLFHSVAMDKNGKVIEDEAKKLGQKASHGCFRLTIPDAKWIYDHIPINTKVVIHD